jgi:glycopeptide antibiotics resistance protein
VTIARRTLDGGLAAALALVALLTLVPTGTGWRWGPPLPELEWYATGWHSGSTMLQLIGNLVLLAPVAALAVLRWPALTAPYRLAAAALATGVGIELLQWLLPLGRVVSPLDAVLNTCGAVAAGWCVAAVRARAHPRHAPT